MSDTPRPPGKSPQRPLPFPVSRRRTALACTNCKKRKIRCIAPEQPPINPCARCTRRRLTCEYVVNTEGDSPTPANQSLETGPSHLRDVPMDPASPNMIWTPPMMAPNFSRNMAPPLPYTGPPPLNRRPRYAAQPLPDLGRPTRYSNQEPMHARHLNPPPAASFQPSTDPRFGEQSIRHSSPSFPPAPIHGYDVQAAQAWQYLSTRVRPPPMPTNMAEQRYPSAPNAADEDGMSSGDTPMDEYFEWPPDSGSSGSGYPSTNSRSGYQR
ncbi:hypothetical protein C8R44DRAFT_949406 [Mycena epipterygia]|nr:hypothetical protein C8R44DRAFT_949406 [Mycena epipterygia]